MVQPLRLQVSSERLCGLVGTRVTEINLGSPLPSPWVFLSVCLGWRLCVAKCFSSRTVWWFGDMTEVRIRNWLWFSYSISVCSAFPGTKAFQRVGQRLVMVSEPWHWVSSERRWRHCGIAGLSYNSCVLSLERGENGRCKYNQVDNLEGLGRTFLVLDYMLSLAPRKTDSRKCHCWNRKFKSLMERIMDVGRNSLKI